jgi:diaminohydroxyphosphoribosylaminopyrimidine deaminase / 5-amino-6-(5-phosphoribosylamino)uracil reductase
MPSTSLPEKALENAMRQAIAKAKPWIGATSPNPAVGAAALDAEGNILAVGCHKRHGGIHAESAVLETCLQKNLMDRIHTLAVTLEPCNHHGKTPPCSDAITQAGIKHVVYGLNDPNHEAGGGAARMRGAGIDVTGGILENECRQLVAYFVHAKTLHQPWITVKRAFTQNGSMLPVSGQKTFTSPDSLKIAHRLRKAADAIVTGSGTILADNPEFTVRHVPDHAAKRRLLAVLDRRRRVPQSYIDQTAARHLDCVIYNSIEDVMGDFFTRQNRHILVEAGPTLSDYLLANGLWTLKLDIHQGEPEDRMEYTFNPRAAKLFDTSAFTIENILPTA